MERFGEVCCRDCSSKPVVFRVTCSSGLCDSYRVEDTELEGRGDRSGAWEWCPECEVTVMLL